MSSKKIPNLDASVIPEWFGIFEAAEQCNCPPWELLDQAGVWTQWALDFRSIKSDVEKRLSDKGSKSGKGGRKGRR